MRPFLNAVTVPGRVGMEEFLLDLFLNRDRPFGFLVGRGAVFFFNRTA